MTIHSRVRTTRLAVAALVTCAGAFTSGCTDTTTPEPADRASENTSPPSTPAASDSTATPGTTPGGTSSTDARPGPVGVYYGGATATGWRLFREFRAVPDDAESALAGALTLAVEGPTLDPDYVTLWPEFTRVLGGDTDSATITVDLAPTELELRPASMSKSDARLAVQQLVFTAQAAVGQGRLPVRFLLDGQPTNKILGRNARQPIKNASPLATLNHVNITAPEQGSVHPAGELRISGVANSFEANVLWEIRQGRRAALQGAAQADGWMGDRLFPWTATIDTSELAPGDYEFVAMTDDASGGAEGPGPRQDTKDFTIQ